jgi:hypothetical protein
VTKRVGLALGALGVAAAADGGAIAIANSTPCGQSSSVPAISLAVVGGLVAGALLFAALRPRGAGRAAAAGMALAVVVSIIGAVAVFANGVGCLR